MDLELPDIDSPAAVASLASEVESVGTRTFDLVSSAQETWYNLSGTYRAPEAEAVYNGSANHSSSPRHSRSVPSWPSALLMNMPRNLSSSTFAKPS